MALTKLSTVLNYIQSLADRPLNPAAELKELFDQAGNDIKNYLNDTLTVEVDAHLANTTTAHNINLKANKAMESPISATLQNSFTGTITYQKNDLGQVFVNFRTQRASAPSAGTVITTLPVGYRPQKNIAFAAKQSVIGANIFVVVDITGLVYLSTSTDATNFVLNTNLDGQVTFQV